MYKNKTGFTLIELLAVIIVLIIIILLAINAIRKNVDDTLDNTIVANAGVYIKAVNSFIAVENIEKSDLETGAFSLSELNDLGVSISGTKPDDGYVMVNNSEVTSGCLMYEDYFVSFSNGNFSKVKKGACDEFSKVTDFAYNGKSQKYSVLVDGMYKIELWGAGGGFANATFNANIDHAGYGAYTSGEIYLKHGETLYVYVGQMGNKGVMGSSSRSAATFNGGGAGAGATDNDDASGSGGGATDVRLVNGNWDDTTSLASRIMVAAGGAGSPLIGRAGSYHGGFGGGLTGAGGFYRWENSFVANAGLHATQTSGYLFGKGQDAILGISCAGSGAGGGYWGGKTQQYTSSCGSHGGGGSSYISGHIGCVAITSENDITPKAGCTDGTTEQSCSVHYSNKVFTDTLMKAGNEEMPTFDGSSVMTGNSGNGHARITLLD